MRPGMVLVLKLEDSEPVTALPSVLDGDGWFGGRVLVDSDPVADNEVVSGVNVTVTVASLLPPVAEEAVGV